MKPIPARAWLVETLLFALAGVFLITGVNAWIDIYGIIRNAHGRHLRVYGDDRVGKYLLSAHYVPENFEAILIGSSVSANWPTAMIRGLRTYNESVDGGNIVEEKVIADQAIAQPGIRLAMVIVHPYITSSHDFETVRLTPREKLSVLGSENLLSAYMNWLKFRMHRGEQPYDDFGTLDFTAPAELNPRLKQLFRPGPEFDVDAQAMQSYLDLVTELHQRRIRIVFVIPPTSQKLIGLKAAAFTWYSQKMLSAASQADGVIDFDSDEFASFRSNPANFRDGVHLTHQAAAALVEILSDRIHGWMVAGELPTGCCKPI